MKITVVMDNTVPIGAKSPFLGEHGYSILIEHEEKKILFDAGQSKAVVQNLILLGTLPTELDALVLSHGHYDHSGGLLPIMQHARKTLPLYAHTNIFVTRFSKSSGVRQFIGIPYAKEQLTSLGVDWHLSSNAYEIFPNLWLSGQIPRVTDYELGDKNLLVSCNDGCDCLDPINDDLSLFYRQGEDLVVIGGCTHSGLVNTVQWGFKVTGATRLRGWIGGTHLGPVSSDQQEKTMGFMEQMAPDFIMAAHCTGFPMMAELSKRFGKRYIPGFVSTVVEF